MPSFISVIQALAGNTQMNYVNYESINDNQKEFIRPDLWDVEMTSKPAAVYYPGDPIFKARLTAFAPSISGTVSGISQVIRGYTIMQKTSKTTSGTISMTFVDREDQAITVFCDDWLQKISDRDKKYSFRKEDTICQLKHTIFNTSRIPIRTMEFYTCQPNSAELPEGGTSDVEVSATLSEIPLTLDFEHYTRTFNNLV